MKAYQTGIIFVHGFTESTHWFDDLIAQVPEGVLVHNVHLPGHDATTREFRQTDAMIWLKAVDQACVEMTGQCERVFYVGHSMGCLLGLLIQQKRRALSGMLLLCCPFYVRPTKRYFKTLLLANLTTAKADDPLVAAERSTRGVTADHIYSYLLCTRPLNELFRLIRFTKNHSLHLPEKTVFCHSEQDEIVGRRSADYAKNVLHARVELLPGCGHNYFTDDMCAKVITLLTEMIDTSL